MMKRGVLLVVSCCISFICTFAQVTKNEGMIITSKQDTLKVTVKSGFNFQNDSKVTYKEKELNNSKFKVLGPDQVEKYSTDKGSFISVLIDGKKRFLRSNVVGYVSLYEGVDQKGTVSFYVKKEQNSYVYIDPSDVSGFLSTFLGDCNGSEMTKVIKKAQYSRFRLSNAVSQYNACKKPEKYVALKFKPEKEAIISISTGLTFTDQKIGFRPGVGISSELSSANVYPFIGLNLLVSAEQRLTSGFDLTLGRYDLNLDFQGAFSQNTTNVNSDVELNVSRVGFSPFLRYRLSKTNKVYLRAGLAIDLLSFSSNDRQGEQLIDRSSRQLLGPLLGIDYKISQKFRSHFQMSFQSGGNFLILQNDFSAVSAQVGVDFRFL